MQVAQALLPELLAVASDASPGTEELRAAALSILCDLLKSLGVMAGVYQRQVGGWGVGGSGGGGWGGCVCGVVGVGWDGVGWGVRTENHGWVEGKGSTRGPDPAAAWDPFRCCPTAAGSLHPRLTQLPFPPRLFPRPPPRFGLAWTGIYIPISAPSPTWLRLHFSSNHECNPPTCPPPSHPHLPSLSRFATCWFRWWSRGCRCCARRWRRRWTWR